MSENSLKETVRQNTQTEIPTEVQEPLQKEDPAAEIKRFENAARASEAESNPYFWLDGVLYDAGYVSSFCKHLDNKKIAKDKYIYEVLKASSKKGEKGECFGKKFPSPEDCIDGLNIIREKRHLLSGAITHGVEWSLNPIELMSKLSWENRTDRIECNGKKYDISLEGMSPETQMKYTGILDEEIFQGVDIDTMKFLRSYMPDVSKNYYVKKTNEKPFDYMIRFYKLMDQCGNPKLRPLADSPVKDIIGIDRAHFVPDLDFVGGTCYADNLNVFIAELAHAFRNKNNFFGEAIQSTRDGLKDIITFDSLGFTPEALDKNYKDPTKMEYDTHSIVQPELNAYLDGKTPTLEQMYAKIDMRRKENENTYTPTLSAKRMIEKGYKQFKEAQEKQEEAQKATVVKNVISSAGR